MPALLRSESGGERLHPGPSPNAGLHEENVRTNHMDIVGSAMALLDVQDNFKIPQFLEMRIPVDRCTEMILHLSSEVVSSCFSEIRSGMDDSMIFRNIIFKKASQFLSGFGKKTLNYLEIWGISKTA